MENTQFKMYLCINKQTEKQDKGDLVGKKPFLSKVEIMETE